MPASLIASILLGLGVLLIFIGLAGALSGRDPRVSSRLDQYAAREDGLASPSGGQGVQVTSTLNQMIGRQKFAANLATQLARADLKLTVSEFVLLNLATTLLGFLFFLVLKRDLFLAVLGGVAGYFLPRIWMRRRQSKRIKDFNNQLGDTITLLANSLRSGYSLLQSMETVAKELSPPVSTEFERVVREIGLGLSYEQAMNNMLRRVPSPDLDLMITAINVQHEVGGNLAEILETIGFTIRERIRIQGEIRVLTAQQTGTGIIVGLLPFAVGLILYLINADYILSLFREPCGWAMVAMIFILIGSGFAIIRRIIQIEV
ncbi:MAG: type II secretion system F family protein [Chloroflexi bacterium]|nr:type II secretion system F family protein [Chloroflexota bacterium]